LDSFPYMQYLISSQ